MAKIDPTLHPRIFIVGGAQIYREAIASPLCERVLLTKIHASIPCDSFFPDIDPILFRRASHEELRAYTEEAVPEGRQVENDIEFEYLLFVRRDYQEDI